MITPGVLYASSCRTLTAELERFLNKAQRRMLRMILGSGRKTTTPAKGDTSTSSSDDVDSDPESSSGGPTSGELEDRLETWTDWLKRTTHYMEEQMLSIGIKDWVTQYKIANGRWHRRTSKLEKANGQNECYCAVLKLKPRDAEELDDQD